MRHGDQDFSVQHRGELREALIMVEGEGGGFELLAHGAVELDGESLDWASVRSTGSEAEYLFIHDREPRPGAAACWHLADESERALVKRSLFRG
ncbi:MAG: hypothetical protein IRZ04_19205 [Rhodospirillales bacterium]|nr:hypothetical protein [Rhodospirillales bacterium]